MIILAHDTLHIPHSNRPLLRHYSSFTSDLHTPARVCFHFRPPARSQHASRVADRLAPSARDILATSRSPVRPTIYLARNKKRRAIAQAVTGFNELVTHHETRVVVFMYMTHLGKWLVRLKNPLNSISTF